MSSIYLPQEKVFSVLEKASIPCSTVKLAKTREEAPSIAEKLGFPVVMKIDSPDIVHKTDVGCVKINIKTREEAKAGYEEIISNAKKHTDNINGIIIERMHSGTEIIIGAKKDPTFGHVIMFGLGGVLVEVFKDVSFRIAPIDKNNALGMIQEIKAYSMIKGVRGSKGCNEKALANILLRLSDLLSAHPEIIELDFNPVLANEKEAIVVDARINIEDKK